MSSTMTVDAKVVRRDRWIHLSVMIVLVVFVVYLSLTLRDMTAKAQGLQDELDVQHLLARLLVPTEALYFEEKNLERIIELRQDLYVRHGSDTFVPYAAVVLPSGTTGELPSVVPSRPVSTGDKGALFQSSFESFWTNRIFAACEILASELEQDDGIGSYLLDHPDVFVTRVRPLVARILDAYHPYPRRAACKVLFHAKDRSPELRRALEILAEEDHPFTEADRQQIRELLEEWD